MPADDFQRVATTAAKIGLFRSLHSLRDEMPRANQIATVLRGEWDWPLALSTPERAILELLDELPKRESFHQVDMLMQGLTNLSPRRLQRLLAECHSVKVKRLFFYFADRHSHAWLKRLDRKAVDLVKASACWSEVVNSTRPIRSPSPETWMPFSESYRKQVALLIRVIPIVAEETCFALKGGTAINLFIRDMPRLSVDIDLTYLPVQPYKESLAAIDAAMGRIAAQVKVKIARSTVAEGQQGSRTHLLAPRGQW